MRRREETTNISSVYSPNKSVHSIENMCLDKDEFQTKIKRRNTNFIADQSFILYFSQSNKCKQLVSSFLSTTEWFFLTSLFQSRRKMVLRKENNTDLHELWT
jgi:hypothetical protein